MGMRNYLIFDAYSGDSTFKFELARYFRLNTITPNVVDSAFWPLTCALLECLKRCGHTYCRFPHWFILSLSNFPTSSVSQDNLNDM